MPTPPGTGRSFVKMTGSGNDFLLFDTRHDPPGELAEPRAIQALCARGDGIGADGVVFLGASETASYRMTYFNSDGSPASLCGNASLCSVRLAVELGMAPAEQVTFESDSGLITGRLLAGTPEIDLQLVREVEGSVGIALAVGERRMGFSLVGVPHLVVLSDSVSVVDVARRGAELRRHPDLRGVPGAAEGQKWGANVNFVSPAVPSGSASDDRSVGAWLIRTYERGVEGETLACGSGAVAAAILLQTWGMAGAETRLTARSGRALSVRVRRRGGLCYPSLSGEARIVYRGVLAEYRPAPR
ncbi:MAG: diaminopimelate epimerase [Gemmatimonadaceae bacterium]